MKTIDVGIAFSRYPGGRYRADGPNSGERFRDEVLAPALGVGPVTVNLDGAVGYGSSFLEEAFGGLVRTSAFSLPVLKRNLTLASTEPSLITEIWAYIHDAAKRQGA